MKRNNPHSSTNARTKYPIQLVVAVSFVILFLYITRTTFDVKQQELLLKPILNMMDTSAVNNNNNNMDTTTTTSTSVNMISKSRVLNFIPHYEALLYSIQPGRGYKPTRHLTWLPEVTGSFWWINETVPESFSFPILDQTYDRTYFEKGGHPIDHTDIYVQYVLKYTKLFLPKEQNDVQTLVEFGNGGGYFARRFSDILGSDSFVTVEGTGEGIAETLNKWKLLPEQVVQHDLRLPLYLGRRFDVAVCTEVVEHVEPPFTSQIISTLVAHADIIWFSFKPLGEKNRAWINHPNERPLKMWKNLFDFYGYDIVMIPNKVTVAVLWRGNFIAYRRDNIHLSKVTEQDLIDNMLPTEK